TIDVSAGSTCVSGVCGTGGDTELFACTITVKASTGKVLSKGGKGGHNNLTARQTVKVDGTVDARSSLTGGASGANYITLIAGGAGTVCRPAMAICDVPEVCTATSPTCPADITLCH